MDENFEPNILANGPALNVPSVGAEGGRQRTAKKAVEILIASGQGYHLPTRTERRNLLMAFASREKVLYGAAFDVIRTTAPVDLSDPMSLAADLDHVTVLEIKSTNRPNVGSDLRGYFFALTTAELLVAQSLKKQFQFAFVHTLTGTWTTLSLQELFAKARGIYPTWSIQF